MKTIEKLWIACLLSVALSQSAVAKLNVVATTSDLAAIAQAVGGDEVAITILARPTEDPHFVDAKPSFVVKLNRADALVHGGAELESGWLAPLLAGARNAKLAPGAAGNIDCHLGVTMLEVPASLDRARGDIHAMGNPHYLIDPENAKIVARHLASAFGKIDSNSSGNYQDNAEKFIRQLDEKLGEWRKSLAPFEGVHLVSYHNSWLYFGRRFGLVFDLHLEPKPGIPPSPAHLATIMGKMKQLNARVIVRDPYLNRSTADTVARNTSAIIVDVSQFPGGVKGTEGDYVRLLDTLVNALAKALQGKP